MLMTADGSVKFPGLGVEFEHLAEGFELFGVQIAYSGILIAVALFAGLFIAERLAKKTGQNTEFYLDLAIRLVIAGVVGGRSVYVLTHGWEFAERPIEVFLLNRGGLSFNGALLAGLLMSFLYCRQRKRPWLLTCDTALIGVLAGQIIGRFGDFFHRASLGTYTDSIFAMQVEVADVDLDKKVLSRASFEDGMLQGHPVVLYEVVLLVILLCISMFLYFSKKMEGLVFAVYLMGYGSIRFSTEFIRLESARVIGNRISAEHILAGALVAAGVVLGATLLKRYLKTRRRLPKNYLQPKNK